jgi:hypothetical protein
VLSKIEEEEVSDFFYQTQIQPFIEQKPITIVNKTFVPESALKTTLKVEDAYSVF